MIKKKLLLVVLLTTLAITLTGQTSISNPHPHRDRKKTVNACPEETNLRPHSDDFSDWNTYRSERFGIEFKFPPQGTLDVRMEPGKLSIRLDLPKESGTLLTGKFLSLLVRKSFLDLVEEVPLTGLKEGESEFVEVTGEEFEKFRLSEGAAGSRYDSTIYLTRSEGYYYLFDFVLRSSNPDVYGDDPPPNFNRAEEREVFVKLLSTVKVF